MLKFPILKKHHRRQKGLASIEAIVSATMFVALLSFSLGFFGVVHSGIVNSIAARSYAFDTFNNRTYLKYHRDTATKLSSHQKNNFRLHAIIKENYGGDIFVATQRYIAFAKNLHHKESKGEGEHNNMVRDEMDNNNNSKSYEFDPVWVKTAYGICLNANCTPQQ